MEYNDQTLPRFIIICASGPQRGIDMASTPYMFVAFNHSLLAPGPERSASCKTLAKFVNEQRAGRSARGGVLVATQVIAVP